MTSAKPPIIKQLHVPLSDLEVILLGWTADHWPECFAAIEERWGDWDWVRRCLGSSFRRIAAVDMGWVWRMIDERGADVIALGRFIKAIKSSSGYEVAPGACGSWTQYVADVQMSFSLKYATAPSEAERLLPDGYQRPVDEPAPVQRQPIRRTTEELEQRGPRARKVVTAAGGGLWE